MKDVIVGIDLGTTYSAIAVVIDGQVTVIKEGDSFVVPSIAGISESGQAVVGEAAKRQHILSPERMVKSIKRRMGSHYHATIDDENYTPQEISALILKHLKKLAEDYLGMPVNKAVVTVPAYFSDSQRLATKEAGMIAGLDVVRMINEPTAAALAYEEHEKTSRRILVYDLGGGTFDVSVVAIENGVIEVLASHGNPYLGGDDFDAKIVSKILDLMLEGGVDLSSDRTAMVRVRQIAEAAKITLTDHPFVQIKKESLAHDQDGQPLPFEWELARDEYETMIQPFVDETLKSVHIALRRAELNAADIDQVVLVGGSTRTPLVQRRLKSIFNQQPHAEIDPSLCVATGAAMQAAAISGEPVSGVLIDITPYTFGISTLDNSDGEIFPYSFMPIIEKNSILPIEKSEVFYTATEGQTSVEINVYQGEDPDALKNHELGKFMVEGLEDVPVGNPILVSFKLDLDGLLHVTAQEKNTGLQKTVTIDGASGGLSEQALNDSKARINALDDSCEVETEQDENMENYPLLLAQAVISEAEDEVLVHIDGELRENIVEALEALKKVVSKRSDDEEIFRKVGDLSYLICLFRSDSDT